MTATTITTGVAIYRDKEHWVMNSLSNREGHQLYLIPKTCDIRPDFCCGGEWVAATEVSWTSRQGGETVQVD